jgi:Phage major capsid protein E
MATLDIFKQNAFSLLSMLPAVEKVDFLPQRLGQLGIFTPYPVRTKTVAIEDRDGVLSLIPTSLRGAPLEERKNEKRKVRDFRTVRIAKGDRITADELADIRAFGSETETMQVQAEIMRRLAGPVGLMNDVELTLENMRLGCIQGLVKDADGSTIYDWNSEWGITLGGGAEFAFDLSNASPASGAVRTMCTAVLRAMMRNSKGAWNSGTGVYALCGDQFWDKLTAHPEVRSTYLNYVAAADLRAPLAYETVYYGGITFENYRGTDDGTTVGIATDKAKFFPVNAPGVFLEVFSPGENFEYINQPGKPIYPLIVPDRDRQMYADVEVYSYPLHVLTRPLMIQSGRAGA